MAFLAETLDLRGLAELLAPLFLGRLSSSLEDSLLPLFSLSASFRDLCRFRADILFSPSAASGVGSSDLFASDADLETGDFVSFSPLPLRDEAPPLVSFSSSLAFSILTTLLPPPAAPAS